MVDQILTLKEVAAYLKLAEKTAYRLASEGKLPGFKVGGSWRFKREDLEAWIEEQKSHDWLISNIPNYVNGRLSFQSRPTVEMNWAEHE